MELNVKESKLKNPERDLTLNNPVRAEGMPLGGTKVMWLLSKFNRNEIEIITEYSSFIKNQKYLQFLVLLYSGIYD